VSGIKPGSEAAPALGGGEDVEERTAVRSQVGGAVLRAGWAGSKAGVDKEVAIVS
jgi:hypothetical protein